MHNYLTLLDYLIRNGNLKQDRTGTGTLSTFAYQMRFNLQHGFPILTTKKLHFKSIVYELLWFLHGDTNIKYLNANNVHIWDEWADENGDLGPIYGKQWRKWEGKNTTVDQIQNLLHSLKNNSNSRRHIVTAWNPADIDKMALPPCHCLFQFYVVDNTLSCQLYQRSADVFLGVPFNIASYALLTHLIALECNMHAGEFIWTGGDVHLYTNHIEQAKLQLSRTPKALPNISINKKNSMLDYSFEDITLINYDPYPNISAKVAV